MLNKIPLVFLIFISSTLYSQKDSINKIHLYTSPLQMIDIFSRPMITLGSEIIVLKKIGISAEFAYKYKDIDDFDTSFVDSKGYSYRFEIKVYGPYIINSKRIQDYMSIEYKYIKDNYNSMFDYSVDSLRINKLTDNYAIKKDINIGNIKYGLIFGLGKTMYIDLYCGLGLRYRDVSNLNREFNENFGHEHWYPEYFWTISDFEENSGLKFNLTLGLKFGIRL